MKNRAVRAVLPDYYGAKPHPFSVPFSNIVFAGSDGCEEGTILTGYPDAWMISLRRKTLKISYQ
jgi:hypothetical protein